MTHTSHHHDHASRGRGRHGAPGRNFGKLAVAFIGLAGSSFWLSKAIETAGETERGLAPAIIAVVVFGAWLAAEFGVRAAARQQS